MNVSPAITRWPPRAAAAIGALGLLLTIGTFVLPAGAHLVGNGYGGNAPLLVNVASALAYLGVVALGCFVAYRRPRNSIGWLLAVGGCASELDNLMVSYAGYARDHGMVGANLTLALEQHLWIAAVGLTIIFVGLLFPSGRLLSPRWRWVMWATVVGMAVAYVANTVATDPSAFNAPGAINPLRVSGALLPIADVLSDAMLLIPLSAIAAVVALVLRYRRGNSEERHQIRVVMFAASVYALSFGADIVIHAVTGHGVAWLEDVSLVGAAALPAGAALAVLKYRLYDIDVVISRTLVYGSLAALITAVYVGIAVGIGTLVGSGGKPNLGLSILATAIVALGFQPVRERLQRLANRLVYGPRATPYEVLSEFSGRVAESYASDVVLPRMAQVLAEGTGAQAAAVWLRAGASLDRAAAFPADSPAAGSVQLDGTSSAAIGDVDRSVDVRHQGELLGALTVTKRRGESLTPIEVKLMDDLAHQAGLVLKNVGLTATLRARVDDLRASRQRLVAAQDDERRRLERNLHDGAQQHLVAIKVKLGLVELLAARDPAKAKATIVALKHDADEALETLRDLARGIYPPLLAEKGLVVALTSQAGKATIAVRIDGDGVGRYSQDVEAALYFCALEALQNVQKYAGAATATVRLRDEGHELSLEVADDGAGFDQTQVVRGAGLTNMEDRLDALGGTLQIASKIGSGTTLRATLPVVAAAADTVALDAPLAAASARSR